MKNILLLTSAFFFLILHRSVAQTNPVSQTLPYAQNFGSSTFVSMPAGMAAWNGLSGGSIISQALAESSAPTGDAPVTALTAATSTTGGVYGHMPTPSVDARVYVQSSSNATNGVNQVVFAVNTGSFNAVNLSYDLILVNNGGGTSTRQVGSVLQYRQGTSGSWTTVPGSSNLFDGSQAQGMVIPFNFTITGLSTSTNYQFRWALWRPAVGTGNSLGIGIDNINVIGQTVTTPSVSLSVSPSAGSEAGTTIITITATASAPVTANETVNLNVSGIEITAGDYILSNSQITILNAQTTGSVDFTIVNDNLNEGMETAIVSISAVSSGLSIGSPSSVPIDILDNDDAIILPALNITSALTTFNEMEITGISNTTIPRGIYFFEQGSNANLFYRADNGGINIGDSYSYGLVSNTERALGSLTTASLTPNLLGAKLVNNTSTNVNTLGINYTGEQWRRGGNTSNDALVFEVSLDATSLNTGTWTSYTVLSFTALHQGGTASALDGNDPVNRQIFSEEITGFGVIAPGGTAWIRWRDVDVVGSDDGLAIDDLSITPKFVACPAPTVSATSLVFNNITGTTADISWTNGNGTSRLVIARAGSAVTDFPVNGNNYVANNNFGTPAAALGTGYVVFNGTGNTINVNNLTPGTTYHFAVIEYNCNPGEYLTASPATGNFTTPTTPAVFSNVTSLASFSTSVGLPTLPDSIEVSGVFLTNNILITPPTHFQVSLMYASGFTGSVSLAPVAGTVNPTWVYVRYNPAVGGTHSGNISITSTGASAVNVVVTGNATISGGIPALHPLCSGIYSFTQWAAAEPAGTYPANMIFHRFNAQDPLITAQDTANYTLAYNLTTGTRINGLDANGISFLNTGTAGNLGSAVLGLNTIGRSNITVDFTAGLITQTDNNRVCNITFQYRIGNGSWTDLPSPITYTSFGQTNGHADNFTGIVLPSVCDNQPAVYLRWMYHRVGTGSGSRPRMRLDDILVTSSPQTTPSSDIVAVSASEATVIPSTINGPINSLSDGIQVWSFTVRDGGASGDADNLPTLIGGLTFAQGTSNTVSNYTAVIAHAALFDGSVKVADGTMTSTTISFTGLNQTIADDASKTYTLRITLTTSGSVVDGSILQLQIEPSGIHLANACNSSLPAAFGTISSNGTLNVLDVEATRLVFAVPLNVIQNQNFSVTVSARDVQNNIDTNPRQITLSLGTPGTGTLSSITGLGPQTMNNGVYSWTDMQYNVIESFRLEAVDNSLPALTNDTLINCVPACSAPTSPATNLVFGGVTTSSINLSWINGNGAGRIVVARQGSPVVDAPINGTNYNFNINYGTAGTELGSGFVVYNGSGSSVTMNNLQLNTTYHVAVYEYSCNPEFYLFTPLTGSQTTLGSSFVEEQSNETPWSIYPNPASEGWVYFSQPASFELLDISGKVIFAKELANGIDVSFLKSGIYLVRTLGGSVKRLIIK